MFNSQRSAVVRLFVICVVLGIGPGLAERNASAQNKTGSKPKNYNEARAADGTLRPAYAQFMQRTGINPLEPSRRMTESLIYGSPLGDSIRVLPIPLILSAQDLELIREGTRQRGRAMTLFFEDMVIGSQRATGPEGFIEESLVDEIFSDEQMPLRKLRDLWSGRSAADIHYFYGPDIVRNREGNWVVLEDNVGMIGGLGDKGPIRGAFRNTLPPEQQSAIPEDYDFLRMLDALIGKSGGSRNSSLALIDDNFHSRATSAQRALEDLEHFRLKAMLRVTKIPVQTTFDLLFDKSMGDLFTGKISTLLNFDDPQDALLRGKMYFDLFRKRGISMLVAPGTEVLGTKGLLPFIEAMIRFYLHEELLIRTQPTKIVRTIPRGAKNWVVKRANVNQGSEVYIGPKLTRNDLSALKDKIAEGAARSRVSNETSLWVSQEYLDPSVISTPWVDYMVDVRPISLALGDGDFYVSEHMWGRAQPQVGNGLNNVSRGSLEVVVLEEKLSCGPELE